MAPSQAGYVILRKRGARRFPKDSGQEPCADSNGAHAGVYLNPNGHKTPCRHILRLTLISLNYWPEFKGHRMRFRIANHSRKRKLLLFAVAKLAQFIRLNEYFHDYFFTSLMIVTSWDCSSSINRPRE